MSYQSKYTGQEIDELLDKINAGGGSISATTLFEGRGLPSTSIELTDSLDDYDYLLAEAQIHSSTEGGIIAINTRLVSLVDHKHSGYGGIYANGTPFTMDYARGGAENIGSLRIHLYKTSISIGTFLTTAKNMSAFLSRVTGFKISNGYEGNSTPTGNIISFMGTKAPQGYLICDGTEYNITDYPKLANHFAEQFENIAYFGGDGVNTFKVPDLRNEFLRGFGDLSGEIGEHQDATNHSYTAVDWNGSLVFPPEQTDNIDTMNTDTKIETNSFRYFQGTSGNGRAIKTYTSRPTNVAVLYCIKY